MIEVRNTALIQSVHYKIYTELDLSIKNSCIDDHFFYSSKLCLQDLRIYYTHRKQYETSWQYSGTVFIQFSG